MDLSDFETVLPSELLRPFVRRYFFSNQALDVPFSFDMLPAGSAYFVNYFSDQEPKTLYRINGDKKRRISPWNFGGPVLKAAVSVEESKEVRLIVCEFTATGFYALFGRHGGEFTDCYNELGDVFPALKTVAQGCFVHDEQADQAVLVTEMNNFLTSLANEAVCVDPHVQKAVEIFEKADGVIKVSEIAQSIGVSERHLGRLFREIVGISPKNYGQVLQINEAVKLMMGESRKALSEIAQEAGFCDQAHLTRTMKTFFSEPPTKFLDSNYLDIQSFLLGDSHYEPVMAKIQPIKKQGDEKS